VVVRGIELAFVAQHGSEYFGVPAAAGRDLDDVHLRLEAEEKQRLFRMTMNVARAVRFRPVRPGERFRDEVVRGRGCERGVAREEQHCNKRLEDRGHG
jgi:hypothetical protein